MIEKTVCPFCGDEFVFAHYKSKDKINKFEDELKIRKARVDYMIDSTVHISCCEVNSDDLIKKS